MPNAPLDIIYVGRLPPHRSGAALRQRQLLDRLVSFGQTVRDFDPLTSKSLRDAHDHAATEPGLMILNIGTPGCPGHVLGVGDDDERRAHAVASLPIRRLLCFGDYAVPVGGTVVDLP